jgi:hypothetical protein
MFSCIYDKTVSGVRFEFCLIAYLRNTVPPFPYGGMSYRCSPPERPLTSDISLLLHLITTPSLLHESDPIGQPYPGSSTDYIYLTAWNIHLRSDFFFYDISFLTFSRSIHSTYVKQLRNKTSLKNKIKKKKKKKYQPETLMLS